MLFNKFQDHTAAIDVWAFGMIMYCVLFGKRPASYYKVYREWFKKSHNADVEIQNLPFIPPSQRNFIYDPFSIDFEMPFDKVDYEELFGKRSQQSDETDLSFGS
jgi:serine/threonine protein kinase